MSQFTLSARRKVLARSLSALVTVLVLSTAFGTVFALQSGAALAIRSECSDGIDNDHNGKTDYPQDENCLSIDDDYEGVNASGNFVTITDDHDTVAPGGAVVYRITLKQQRVTARNVDVVLLLPFQANIASASDGGSVGTDTVKWTNVSVYQNVTRVLTVNVNVPSDAKVGQYLVARVQTDGDEATDTTLVADYVAPQTDMFRVDVSDGKQYILPGDSTTYTIRVRNLSSSAQTNDLHVVIPYEEFFTSASDGYVRDDYNLTWKNVSFAAYEEKTFSFKAQVDPRTGKNKLIRVRAYVGSVSAFDQDVVRIGLPDNAITASITDSRKAARVGEILNYTVKVTNSSDVVATNVSVDTSLPQYAEFVSANEGGTWDGSNVRWLILQIAPHDTRTLTYSIRVRSDAPLGAMLTAAVSADGYQVRDTTLVALDSQASGGVIIGDDSSALFRKTADRGEAVPGGSIRYTLSVHNTLDHAITDATIIDRFDTKYLSFSTSDDPGALIAQTDGQMTWQVPVLQPGEFWQASYVLKVAKSAPNGIKLDNVATIRGSDIGDLSLTETVRTNTSGVLKNFPTTGAGMDSLFAAALGLLALGATAAQRKLAMGTLLGTI